MTGGAYNRTRCRKGRHPWGPSTIRIRVLSDGREHWTCLPCRQAAQRRWTEQHDPYKPRCTRCRRRQPKHQHEDHPWTCDRCLVPLEAAYTAYWRGWQAEREATARLAARRLPVCAFCGRPRRLHGKGLCASCYQADWRRKQQQRRRAA